MEAPRALFIERIKDPGALSRHLVSGQYQFVKTPVLPHAVTGSFSVADRVVEKTGSMRALQIETRFVNLLCRVKEEPYLEVTATMDRGRFTKENARRLPRAIRVALALLASQEVWLMESSVERGRCTYIEVAKKPTPVVLTFLSMFPELDMTVPAGLFWALVQRLVKPSKEQWIIERASEHMMAANQQPTWYGRKLMVGTWLEAALRSYYEKPLSRPNQSWTVEKGLKDFQEHYLGSAWKAVKNDVLRSFSRIRHSTAHPDWVPTPAERDNPATAQEMADLQLLSWFYGRMVLALAGVAGLKPEVPTF
ncbi:MAG: hypothetical protein M5U22_07160 [Thermoleophilia bacterium]|nr:hypothetical protein [Thermoleophilia bacterium]